MDAKQVTSAGVNYGTSRSASGEPNDYVYVVMVFTTVVGHIKKQCVGTLITDTLVMTVASCLLNNTLQDPDPDSVSVIERTGRYLRVLRIFINPKFYSADNCVSKNYDFGLIRVERSDQTDYPRLPVGKFKETKHTCSMGLYENTGRSYNDGPNFKVISVKKLKEEIDLGEACLSEGIVVFHPKTVIPDDIFSGAPIICNDVLYALYTRRQNEASSKLFITVRNIKEWVHVVDRSPSDYDWLNNPWFVMLGCIIVLLSMVAIYWVLMAVLERSLDPEDILQAQIRLSEMGREDQSACSWERGDQED